MSDALKMAARILCVYVLCMLNGSHPLAAQDSAATQQTTQPAAQQPSQPAPPKAPAPTVSQAGDFYAGDGFSITLHYGYGAGHPHMLTGKDNGNAQPSNVDYGGDPKNMEDVVITIPIGKHHALHASYSRYQGSGNSTTPVALTVYGTDYLAGDYLATNYLLQNARLSFDYLSWPFPIKDSKFHIKTLWELQYTNIGTNVFAPLRIGQTDASGAVINTSAYGKDWFIYPSFGLGFDYLASHRFRIEGRASGFAFPHRSTVWDADFSLNYRFGKVEIQGGAKTFHFKTSPQRVEYVYATLPEVYVGFRWYPMSSKR